MKTLHIYEASDIHIGGEGDVVDPVHMFLFTLYIRAALLRPDKETDGTDAVMNWFKGQVAETLNDATRRGISITVSEIPEVFIR